MPADDFATGTRHLYAGRIREAMIDLSRAVANHSTHAAHHNLAVALRAHGDIANALVHANAASVIAPTCAPTLALFGSLLSLSGDPMGAIATFRHACTLDPAHDVSRYYLGIALAVTGHRDAALVELRSLTRLPESVLARVHAQIADLLAGEGPVASDLCSIPIVTELVGMSTAAASFTPPSGTGRTIDLDEARTLLANAQRIVALTGAGISSASGLATRKELWRRHDRDSAVSIAQFHRDPLPLWTVIREFLGDAPIAPNAAHHALAALPNLVAIVTQNVEGLHQAACTPCDVLELHGTLLETRCDSCGARPSLSCAEALAIGEVPPACACGASLRPDVVLFGEWVDRTRLERAAELCASCDLLLVVGTAADVAPAADLPLLAASRGATVIELKRTPSRLARAIQSLHLPGVAEELLPRLVSP